MRLTLTKDLLLCASFSTPLERNSFRRGDDTLQAEIGALPRGDQLVVGCFENPDRRLQPLILAIIIQDFMLVEWLRAWRHRVRNLDP
jgi:hypothetical protein